jgi:hypothetical protein
MKTASLALAKFAIILVCCISPTLGKKRIAQQPCSGAPAFGFYTSELSSDTAVTLRGEIASADRWTALKEFRGYGVTYEITDGQNAPGVKVGEHVTARYYETVTIRRRKPGETVGLVSVTEAIPVAKLGEPFRGGFTRELKIGASIEVFGRNREQLIFRTSRGTSQALAVGNGTPWLDSRRADSNYANSGHVRFTGQRALRPSASSRVPAVIDAHDSAPGFEEAGKFARITSLCAVADSVSFVEPGTELQAKPARSLP